MKLLVYLCDEHSQRFASRKKAFPVLSYISADTSEQVSLDGRRPWCAETLCPKAAEYSVIMEITEENPEDWHR